MEDGRVWATLYVPYLVRHNDAPTIQCRGIQSLLYALIARVLVRPVHLISESSDILVDIVDAGINGGYHGNSFAIVKFSACT